MSENNTPYSYIGKRGYTIYKDSLNIKNQKFIRDSLNVAPFIPNSPIKPESYPVFLESQNKFYLPRYFGITHFGEPDLYKIQNGDSINLNFKGTLRDFQVDITNAYFNSINSTTGGGGLIEAGCGSGKTSMSLFIISKLRVKTLVIVHKTFLLNQWIERIKEFLPDAKIGIIQGQILDVENKDIVIGMLQSLCSKNYPENIINSFGLTVVDECHHLSSRMFSKSLLKIVTKYTLGLSATMQRNDGLSHVFKQFLGDIVYSYSRPKDDKVLIKAIEYNSNDPEFQEIKYDYRGNPQYSTMITKISSYNDRSEFIIKVLQNELNLNKNQHIIILSQNKNLLVYLYNSITHRNIGTVGYYVGGMKEPQLKETENKKIILATYAMAAEGLDIKTLSTLILASPRSDITQAVGRILRVKRDQPLVIDIIDEHSIFKNQFKKRKTFYNKNNYKIIYTNNNNYFNNIWTEIPNKKNSSKIKNNTCLLKI